MYLKNQINDHWLRYRPYCLSRKAQPTQWTKDQNCTFLAHCTKSYDLKSQTLFQNPPKQKSLRLLDSIHSIRSHNSLMFSPINLPFMNPFWSEAIGLLRILFILFATQLEASLWITGSNVIGRQCLKYLLSLFGFGMSVMPSRDSWLRVNLFFSNHLKLYEYSPLIHSISIWKLHGITIQTWRLIVWHTFKCKNFVLKFSF